MMNNTPVGFRWLRSTRDHANPALLATPTPMTLRRRYVDCVCE
jgi:hypothetical protein